MSLKSLRFISLIAILPTAASVATPEAEFDSKFNEGFEPAIVLQDHGSDDGSLSVIFSARKNGLGAAKWPSIIEDVSINGTSIDLDNCISENWIISLDEKKRLGVVKSTNPDFRAIYPEQNHQELAALWGPNQEGWHYGVLNYSGRWSCTDIFFVNSDGVEAKITSMRDLLDGATKNAITAKSKNPAEYEITYEIREFVNPEASATVADPITVRIAYIAQIPKDEDAEPIEGVLAVELSRDEKGIASAKIIDPADAPADSPQE